MSQLRADQFITELCECLSSGEYSPRQNIYHCGLDWADFSGIKPWEFKKSSTALPSIWEEKSSPRIEKARLSVEKQRAGDAKHLRAVIEQREALSGKTLKEQVVATRAFFAATRQIIRRANAALREAGAKVEVILAANQIALRSGVLCPHVHLLLLCQPGVTADSARSAVRELFEGKAAALAYASPEKREFLNDAKGVATHVGYLYKYPVTRYVEGEKETELLPLLHDEPRGFVAALAGLSTGAGLSLKNTVTVMGSLRAKPTSAPNTITDTEAPIRVAGAGESIEPSANPGGKVEGADYLSGQELERWGHYYEPPPINDPVNLPPVWERMLTGELSAPAVPPARRCKLPPACSPMVLRVVDEPTPYEGFFRRRLLLRGCRGMTIAEVADRFPEHGEAWVTERNFDALIEAGHGVAVALRLARMQAVAWRQSKEAERAANALRIGELDTLLKLSDIVTRPAQLALPAPDYARQVGDEVEAARQVFLRGRRREWVRYRVERGHVAHGETVIITPPANGRFPRPSMLSFAASKAELHAEIRAETKLIFREV